MKHIAMLAVAIALIASLAACGSSSSSAPASSEAPVSSSDAAISIEAAPQPAGESTILSGVITDATMNTATIKAEDGKDYSFTLSDTTDRSKVDGMLIGDTLIVTYTGEIGEDGSTDGVSVLAIEQLPAAADAATPVPAATLEPAAESSAASSEAAPAAESSAATSEAAPAAESSAAPSSSSVPAL